jgi:hypothetical protein
MSAESTASPYAMADLCGKWHHTGVKAFAWRNLRRRPGASSFVYFYLQADMVEVGDYLRPLMLKDLRTQCRARGLNPGGSRSALQERVGEHMTSSQDLYARLSPSDILCTVHPNAPTGFQPILPWPCAP